MVWGMDWSLYFALWISNAPSTICWKDSLQWIGFCMYKCIYIYSQFSLFKVVTLYKVLHCIKCWFIRYWIITHWGNTSLWSQFSSSNQYITLFYVCFPFFMERERVDWLLEQSLYSTDISPKGIAQLFCF